MKFKDQQILEERYDDVLRKQKFSLTVTFFARYNGWSVSNGDEKLEAELTELGSKFYDEEDDLDGYPSKEEVGLVINKYFNKPIKFDYIINETDS
jgi:hypothetical protein